MTGGEIVALSVGVLGFLSTIITLVVTRRKLSAEREKILAEAESVRSGAASTDVDAFDKFSELLKKLQDRNDELYQENVVLEVKNTEKTRSIESLTIRLGERDAQLTQATKQLDLLRELAKQAPITDTLKLQLESMNVIVSKLQEAQADMQLVLKEKEKAYNALFESTRNLQLKGPKATS